MTRHEYIVIAISIILGLAMARVLHSAAFLVRARDRMTRHWSTTLWLNSVPVYNSPYNCPQTGVQIMIRKTITFLAVSSLLAAFVGAQQSDISERFKQMSAKAEERGLAEPFRGVAIGGEIQGGLFPIRSTGVSTGPVRDAADTFIEMLTEEQQRRALYAVDDSEWRKWMNQHFYVRQGVSFKEMNDEQRESAFGLLRASLSAKGTQLSRDIMRLDHTLGELSGDNFDEYGEWLYSITVMGEPSATEPWGWQMDGHHLIINYFVLGDQVVMSPAFFGSEPVKAEAGKFKGVEILQDEQDLGLAFMKSLSEEQQASATLTTEKDHNFNVGEAFKDNIDIDVTGLAGSEMSDEQQSGLLALIKQYVGNMNDGHAEIKMEEVARHLDDTRFTWIGDTADDAVFYYRILSPVTLIEFDHQKPANLRHIYPPVPNRHHIHTVIRTPNGNDYGKDLLRQHYEQHQH